MGRSSDGQVKGYRYLFGIHMGICRGPVDELVEVKVGDKSAWRGSVRGYPPPGFVGPWDLTPTEVAIDAYDLFGGEDGEGGVQGTLTVMMGGPTQTAPSALATVLKTPMPGFRRMLTAFFDGIVTMINPYPKKWQFRARRALAGWDGDPWYPEKALISLVRPVSAGETQGSNETQIITTSEQKMAVEGPADTFTITLSGSSIEGVNELYYQSDETNFRQQFTETTHYTRVGSVITFTEAGLELAGGPFVVVLRQFFIEYTYELTTFNPLGGLGDVLIQAMNGVHIIYECYTNREWGRGLPREALDEESWQQAADTLFTERFGLCLRWTRTSSVQDFIQAVLDHIGAAVYPDRTTAKLKIKLIRDDYIRSELPLFDNTNGLLEITEAAISAQPQMINEVRVMYRDPVTNENRTVRASNLASVQASGGITNTLTKEFKGLPTADLASRVAKRELRALSPSIRKFNLVYDRRGFDLVPGGVVRVQDLSRNLSDTVLRIGQVDYGGMSDGRIKVVAMQDVFGLPSRGFTTLGPPQWNPPNNRPCIGWTEVFELPYRNVYRAFNQADFAYVTDTSAFAGVLVQEGNKLNLSFDLAVREGAVEPEDQPADGEAYICGFDFEPKTPVSADLSFSWNVQSSAERDTSFSWDILDAPSTTAVENDLSLLWNIENSVAAEIEGFAGGLTNTGTLGGSFVPSVADETSTYEVTAGELRANAKYLYGGLESSYIGLSYSKTGVTALPTNTPWTFYARIQMNVIGNNTSALLNSFCQAVISNVSGAVGAGGSSLYLDKPASSGAMRLVSSEAGILVDSVALNTAFDVIVSTEFDGPESSTGVRRFFVNGSLVATVNLTLPETLPTTRNMTFLSTYYVLSDIITSLETKAVFSNVSLVRGFAYNP
jgi:Putative phage tail protein